MKRTLRRKILDLIYELEMLRIYGADTEGTIEIAFQMMQVLVDEKMFNILMEMWEHRATGSDTESMIIGLMKFDRDARYFLLEEKYL